MIVVPEVYGTFHNGDARFVLRIPAVSLEPGQLVYVAGPNGSGKSLYLRSLAGDTISGRAEGRGRRIGGSLGAIFLKQEPDANLAQSLTARENLSLWRHPSSPLDWLFPPRRVGSESWTAAFPSLRDVWDQNIDTLSGGQKQALALLSRSQGKGKVLLLDEITASIDATAAPLLLQFLRKTVRDSERNAIIVGHNIDEIHEYADRVLVLSRGALFQDIQSPTNGRIATEVLTSVLFEAWRDHLELPH